MGVFGKGSRRSTRAGGRDEDGTVKKTPEERRKSPILSRIFWTNFNYFATFRTMQTSIRVSISEASKLFGIHERTVRRALRTGELRYVIVRSRYKILFDSLLSWSQRRTTIAKKRDEKGIGQWVDQWKIRNTLYSPRPPEEVKS